MDAWWSRYSAEVSAEKEKVREHKDEDKAERKNMYALLRIPVQSITTHGRFSVHAKLARAGYSAIDFPRWIPEWEKTVTKRVNLTDKCTVTGSSSHVPTDHFRRLEFEDVPKVERDD